MTMLFVVGAMAGPGEDPAEPVGPLTELGTCLKRASSKTADANRSDVARACFEQIEARNKRDAEREGRVWPPPPKPAETTHRLENVTATTEDEVFFVADAIYVLDVSEATVFFAGKRWCWMDPVYPDGPMAVGTCESSCVR